ncbi:MAG: dTDP-4-dehydrorhamnose 3,5-epimerase [Chloroflexota bacterium]
MKFTPAKLNGILIMEPRFFQDERGFFTEMYQHQRFTEAGIPDAFVQDNLSGSRRGILRGLHYQVCKPQGKLVRVTAGEVYDVAVDLRSSSPTFGQWMGMYISANNHIQLWIPPGFAHGFYVLSEWAELLYKVTDFYAPEYEHTLLWSDVQVNIAWPLIGTPLVSDKDQQGKSFVEADKFD